MEVIIMDNHEYTVTIRSDFIRDKALKHIFKSFRKQLKDYQGEYDIDYMSTEKNHDAYSYIRLTISGEDLPDIYIPNTKSDHDPTILISAPSMEEAGFINNRIRKQLVNNDDYDDENKIFISMISTNGALGITLGAGVSIPELHIFKWKEE